MGWGHSRMRSLWADLQKLFLPLDRPQALTMKPAMPFMAPFCSKVQAQFLLTKRKFPSMYDPRRICEVELDKASCSHEHEGKRWGVAPITRSQHFPPLSVAFPCPCWGRRKCLNENWEEDIPSQGHGQLGFCLSNPSRALKESILCMPATQADTCISTVRLFTSQNRVLVMVVWKIWK